jgi:uncharacterized protein YpmB
MKTRTAFGTKRRTLVIAGAMILITGITLFAADETDRALDQIKASTKEAVAQAAQLATQSTNIRTVNDAVTALQSFYNIVQRLNDNCIKILQELAADLDTKKLSSGIAELRKQTQAAGAAFAEVMGKIPQDILTSDAFMEILIKINEDIKALKKETEE